MADSGHSAWRALFQISTQPTKNLNRAVNGYSEKNDLGNQRVNVVEEGIPHDYSFAPQVAWRIASLER